MLPAQDGGYRFSNADPVTGQAAWYDLRVRVEKCAAERDRARPTRIPTRSTAPPGPASPAHPALQRGEPGDDRAPARPARRSSASSSISTPASAARPARPTARNGTPAATSAPLTDSTPTAADAEGVWLNRVHSYEAGEGEAGRTVHFPRSCLHCETPACVTVCPTGASYKRAEDGIVLVNPDTCIGCKLCSWACPYGAREFDEDEGVMKKCTLCVDRIYNETLPEPSACRPASSPARPARGISAISAIPNSEVSQLVAERGGYDLMPELGYTAGQQVPAAARASRR